MHEHAVSFLCVIINYHIWCLSGPTFPVSLHTPNNHPFPSRHPSNGLRPKDMASNGVVKKLVTISFFRMSAFNEWFPTWIEPMYRLGTVSSGKRHSDMAGFKAKIYGRTSSTSATFQSLDVPKYLAWLKPPWSPKLFIPKKLWDNNFRIATGVTMDFQFGHWDTGMPCGSYSIILKPLLKNPFGENHWYLETGIGRSTHYSTKLNTWTWVPISTKLIFCDPMLSEKTMRLMF